MFHHKQLELLEMIKKSNGKSHSEKYLYYIFTEDICSDSNLM